jgi:N-acetylglutamate synthase-like GNAT family acetyltransferase
VPGEWWRVEEDGRAVGYGWMDTTWNGGEILLAVHPEQQGRGLGGFILDHLEAEAATRGLNYIYNVVPDQHPRRADVTRWLASHGFQGGDDGQLRRQVPRA